MKIYVVAYPRSGITWTIRTLSNALGCPWKSWIDDNILHEYQVKKTDHLVVKAHIDYHPGEADRVIWVHRDPRDVAISRLFYRGDCYTIQQVITEMCTVYDPDRDLYGSYEKFIRFWLDNPPDSSLDFSDLYFRPRTTLMRLLHDIDPSFVISGIELMRIVEHENINNILGRRPELSHSVRKGVVGDWRNHFHRSDAKLIDDYLGELMLEQGYITNRDWWKEVPE